MHLKDFLERRKRKELRKGRWVDHMMFCFLISSQLTQILESLARISRPKLFIKALEAS